jgi:hypothetical protein
MTTRGEFLAGAALATAAPSIAASPAPTSSPSPEPSFPPLHFDVSRFDAALATTAEHRHLFATTKIEGGLALGQMRGVLDAYKEIGVAAADVHPVGVFYHGGSVVLGFDDAMWNEYFSQLHPKGIAVLKAYEKDFDTVYDSKTRGNPCLHKTGKKDDSSIESLVSDADARFFVCNNAAKGFALFIARSMKLDPLSVYSTLAGHLVPNAMLVPAGTWAVHAIQERHYTYLQATL